MSAELVETARGAAIVIFAIAATLVSIYFLFSVPKDNNIKKGKK